MQKLLVLVAVLLVGYLLFAHVSSPDLQIIDKVTISENILTVADRDSSAYFSYKISDESNIVSGAIFQFSPGQGSVETLGRIMAISYLDGTAYKTFKSQYGGDIRRCPAPFLNSNTKVLHVFVADERILSRLQTGVEGIVPGQESVNFSFTGRPLSFHEGKAKNGRDLLPDFGGQPLFLIENVTLMR